MSIEDALLSPVEPDYTPRRPVLKGSLSINKASIPYFQSVMTLEEVEKELHLVENLPSDLRSKWRLEELFQREIDWKRVEVDIVNGYLRRPEKLQFFNSLTVALLPLNEDRMLDKDYGLPGAPPPLPGALSKEPWEAKNVGGVQIVTAASTPSGFISWDKRRIYAATIDGQHRLAALQTLVRTGNLPLSTLKTTIPVIFLVLDPSIGLTVPESQFSDDANRILGIVREVFIDLNKSAQAVVRARRILLDDQEIECRCIRQLLATRIGEDVPDRLSLGLVHWQHAVTAKFNAGKATAPFITTVELLYSIMKDVLEITSPDDPLEESKVRRFINSVEDSLHVSDLVSKNPDRYQNVPKLISYVEQNYLKEGFEQPFSNLPGPYLRACDDGFVSHWKPLFLAIFQKFQPYREFTQEVRKRGGVDGELAFYLALPERAQKQLAKSWAEDRVNRVDKPQEELAKLKTRDWPFYAVFQKALFRTSALLWRNQPQAASDPEAFLADWIGFLDKLYAARLLEVQAQLPSGTSPAGLWLGIALNPGAKTVKWTESTVERIHSMLLLWWYMYSHKLRQPKRFFANVNKPKGNSKYPAAKKAVGELKKSLRPVVVGSDESDVPDSVEEARAEARLSIILEQVVPFLPAPADGTAEEEGAEEEDPALGPLEPWRT